MTVSFKFFFDKTMLLENKTAIITGGASGLGEATCLTFVREGAKIVVADMNSEGAKVVEERAKTIGGEAMSFVLDVTDPEKVGKLVQSTVERFGTIDILVNCAGIFYVTAAEDIPVEEWKRVMDVNLNGTWHCCQAVMKVMMKKRSGKIVNVSAGAGLLGVARVVHYSSSKHAVVGLTRSLATELGQYNINVNCICPGTFPSPLLYKAMSQQAIEQTIKRHPLGRMGKPEEIANAALFLASHLSDFITGVALPVDGGLTCCTLYPP